MKTGNPMLERLRLSGFRSFDFEEVPLDNPMLLVGQNGSGKSNLTDALAFLSDAMRRPLREVVETRGGFPVVAHRSSARGRPLNLNLSAVLRDPDAETRRAYYSFGLRPKNQGEFEVARELCVVEGRDGSVAQFHRSKKPRGREHWASTVKRLVPVMEPNHLALPMVGGDRRFRAAHAFLSAMQVCRIEPEALRSLQDPESGTRLRSDGSNAASVLREIQRGKAKDREVMRELLEAVVPGTVDFQVKRLGPKLTIEFSQQRGADAVRFPAASMSDGTLRLLGLLLAVFQQPRPTVLVIEEPEVTMHPGALGAITDVLRHASRYMQVVVTTHSPEVLDAEWIDDRHLRLIYAEHGFSHVRAVSGPTRQALKEHLMSAGELLRANALRPSTEPEADAEPQWPFADDSQ